MNQAKLRESPMIGQATASFEAAWKRCPGNIALVGMESDARLRRLVEWFFIEGWLVNYTPPRRFRTGPD